jgi:hypothetical protein
MSADGTEESVISGMRVWAGEKRRRTEFIPLPLDQTRETDSPNERNEFRFRHDLRCLSANQRLDRFQALVGSNARTTTFSDLRHTSERPTVGLKMGRRWTCIAAPSGFRVNGQSSSTQPIYFVLVPADAYGTALRLPGPNRTTGPTSKAESGSREWLARNSIAALTDGEKSSQASAAQRPD